jgi:hypothetical protein
MSHVETDKTTEGNCNEREGRENYAMAGGARGEVTRGTSTEISNATAAVSSLLKTGIIAMLSGAVKIAEPAVAQNGQKCDASPFAFVSAHKWNCPARNRIASRQTKKSRACFPLM